MVFPWSCVRVIDAGRIAMGNSLSPQGGAGIESHTRQHFVVIIHNARRRYRRRWVEWSKCRIQWKIYARAGS